MEKKLDKLWCEWIDLNLQRGCDPSEIYDILIKHGFSPFEFLQKFDLKTLKEKEENLYSFPKAAKRLDISTVDIYTFDDFLSESECKHLVNCIQRNLRKSTTTNDNGKYSTFRTSSTCDLGLLEDPLVASVDERICNLIGMGNRSEPIQGQWYEMNQEFKAHTDYFEPNSKEFFDHAKHQGQRTWTFMVYLNDTKEGGSTYFPRIDKEFIPKTGKAVFWNNLTKQGLPNPETLHHGMPVLEGHKAIITKWFRAHS